MKTDILFWPDDGLPAVVKRSQFEDKYRTLFNYMTMFSTGMKDKWGRVYIDLYAGSGCVKNENTNKIFKGSALLSLSVANPFDKYIFCEDDKIAHDALSLRIQRNFSTKIYKTFNDDCNLIVEQIISEIPKTINGKGVLVLCVLDPDALVLKFETIKKIAATGKADFIVLMALMMDLNRNWKNYLQPSNSKVEKFLALSDWRTRWEVYKKKDDSPARFFTSEFEAQMVSIGYHVGKSETPKKEIRSAEKNLPLYHLAFFSKNARGIDLWKKSLKYSSGQIGLDL